MDRKQADVLYEQAAKAIRELGGAGEIEEITSLINRCFNELVTQPGTNRKVGPLLTKMTDVALFKEREWNGK